MRHPFRFITSYKAILMLVLLTVICSCLQPVSAQSSRDRRDQSSGKQLEIRIEKAEDALVQELSDVASELYKQGEREKSLDVLKRLQQIKSDLPGLKSKMDQIREELMSDNEMEVDFDVSHGWGTPLALVGKGKPFRMVVTGEYKMTLSTTVPLSGLPTRDPAQDHLAEAAFGALVGIIVTDSVPGKPFPVSENLQMTPKKDGQLFIRVNVPAIARCNGRLDVKLSGYVQPVGRKR
jgi:hypothetical protein